MMNKHEDSFTVGGQLAKYIGGGLEDLQIPGV
jgi:hypothetical protein